MIFSAPHNLITEWMRSRLRMAAWPVPIGEDLPLVERTVRKALQPPGPEGCDNPMDRLRPTDTPIPCPSTQQHKPKNPLRSPLSAGMSRNAVNDLANATSCYSPVMQAALRLIRLASAAQTSCKPGPKRIRARNRAPQHRCSNPLPPGFALAVLAMPNGYSRTCGPASTSACGFGKRTT